MPQETVEERAERQARLSRAMGAMFLQDKAQRLEKEAHQAAMTRGMARSRSGPNHVHRLAQPHGAPFRADGGVRVMARSSTGPGFAASSADRITTSSHPFRTDRSVAVYLIDTSVLIYSLRTVHEWLKDPHIQMIVPLEAINNLDLLKKGQDPVNSAARKATRFLEERVQPGPRTQGTADLFCQMESERADIQTLESKRLANKACQPPRRTRESSGALWDDVDSVTSSHDGIRSSVDQSDPSTQGDDQETFAIWTCPRFIRELLSAAVFIDDELAKAAGGDVDGERPRKLTVAVAVPEPRNGGQELPYGDRADGRLSSEWLKAVGVHTEVVPLGKSWKASHAGHSQPSEPRSTRSGSPPMILRKPTSNDRLSSRSGQDGAFVPPTTILRKPGAAGAPPTRNAPASCTSASSTSGSLPFGSVSILKSRGGDNRSQDSFQSMGTGTASPTPASRNASSTNLSRPSFDLSSASGLDEDDAASFTTTSSSQIGAGTASRGRGPVGCTRPSRDESRGPQTAAERLEEHLRSMH